MSTTIPVTTNPQHLILIRDYQSCIDTCREQFRIVNNDNTEFGATPGAFLGNPSGPKDYAPSAYTIYNGWASEQLKKLIALKKDGKLVEIANSQQSFDAWHQSLLDSLDEAWKSRAHSEFSLKRRQLHKLVNLFVKWLRTKPLPLEVRDAIEQWGHTTLSRPTMERIGALLQDETLSFPPDDEFGDWYLAIQKRLRAFTNENGGSPILVDIYCRRQSTLDPDED